MKPATQQIEPSHPGAAEVFIFTEQNVVVSIFYQEASSSAQTNVLLFK